MTHERIGVPAQRLVTVPNGSVPFLSGAHVAALVTAGMCLVGALLSWAVVRRGTTAVGMPTMH